MNGSTVVTNKPPDWHKYQRTLEEIKLEEEVKEHMMKKLPTTFGVDIDPNHFRGDDAAANPRVDLVNHPPHYTRGIGPEMIEVVEALNLGFHLGNAMKYIWRAGHKNENDPVGSGIQDLEKAKWYIDRFIAKLRADASQGTPR